jgi:hypothetical protein
VSRDVDDGWAGVYVADNVVVEVALASLAVESPRLAQNAEAAFDSLTWGEGLDSAQRWPMPDSAAASPARTVAAASSPLRSTVAGKIFQVGTEGVAFATRRRLWPGHCRTEGAPTN